jgi:hypothetical protein
VVEWNTELGNREITMNELKDTGKQKEGFFFWIKKEGFLFVKKK